MMDALTAVKEKLFWLGFPLAQVLPSVQRNIEKGCNTFSVEHTLCFDGITLLEMKVGFRASVNVGTYVIAAMEGRSFTIANPLSPFSVHMSYPGSPIFTLLEWHNLLQLRFVHKKDPIRKEGDPSFKLDQSHWYYVDMNGDLSKHLSISWLHQCRDFNIEEALSMYPGIVELQDEWLKEWVIVSVGMGNRHPVTLVTARSKRRMFIEANALAGTINIFPWA
jgi:hypothetical protein